MQYFAVSGSATVKMFITAAAVFWALVQGFGDSGFGVALRRVSSASEGFRADLKSEVLKMVRFRRIRFDACGLHHSAVIKARV